MYITRLGLFTLDKNILRKYPVVVKPYMGLLTEIMNFDINVKLYGGNFRMSVLCPCEILLLFCYGILVKGIIIL